MLNTILHHVGMLWIVETNQKLKYDIDKHSIDWIAGGTWYNTYICKKVHGGVFVNYIRNARTQRYKLMCFIFAHEKQQP